MYNTILEAPMVLILQLMRFTYNMSTNQREKIDTKYTFPHELNLTDEMSDKSEVIYDLCGVIVHSGCAFGGHYYSYVGYDGDWYCTNDSYVTNFDMSKLPKVAQGGSNTRESAYILFYRKRTYKKFPMIEVNQEMFEAIETEIEDSVRNQIAANKEYKNFISKMSMDTSNPNVVLSCLSRQKTVEKATKDVIIANVAYDSAFIYNVATMKDLLLICVSEDVRQFIADTVKDIVMSTKNTNVYMQFLRDNIRTSVRYFQNFDQFLQPLTVCVKIDVSSKEVIQIAADFVDELETFTASHNDLDVLSACKCGVLFKCIIDTMKEDDKASVETFIRKSVVKGLRQCFKETSKLRSLCVTEETQDALTKALSDGEPYDAAEAFMTLSSLGHFKDVECVSKMKKPYFTKFMRELSKISTNAISHFFASEQWWVQKFLLDSDRDTRGYAIQTIHRAFPSAPQLERGDTVEPMCEEERSDIVSMCVTMFRYMPFVVKKQLEFSEDFYKKSENLVYDYVSVLKWGIMRAECENIVALQYDVFLDAIKKLKRLEFETDKVCDVISLLSETLRTSDVRDFFKTAKNYISMCNAIFAALKNNHNSYACVSHFLISTSERDFSTKLHRSQLLEHAVRGLRSTQQWNEELAKFFLKYMTDDTAAKIVKFVTDSDNRFLFSDTRYESLGLVIEGCLLRVPTLSERIIDSFVLQNIYNRIDRNSAGDFIILSALLFAKMGTSPRLIQSVNNMIPRMRVMNDWIYTWKLFESFLVSGKNLAKFAINQLQPQFLNNNNNNNNNNENKLSFVRTCVMKYKDDEKMRKIIVKKLSNALNTEDGETINAFCFIVSCLLDSESASMVQNCIDCINVSSESAFGQGTKQFCKKAFELGFDISPVLRRCFTLIQSFGDFEELTTEELEECRLCMFNRVSECLEILEESEEDNEY